MRLGGDDGCRPRVQNRAHWLSVPPKLLHPHDAGAIVALQLTSGISDGDMYNFLQLLVSASGYGPVRLGVCRTSWHCSGPRSTSARLCALVSMNPAFTRATAFTSRRFLRRVRQTTNIPQVINPAARSFPGAGLARWRVALGYVSGFLFRDFTPETQSCGFTELHRLLHW
jgi:hypothetical protein